LFRCDEKHHKIKVEANEILKKVKETKAKVLGENNNSIKIIINL
jgi:phenylpyruvate tautomerase PptA (4-oxalocrotonate tautomerase family)